METRIFQDHWRTQTRTGWGALLLALLLVAVLAAPAWAAHTFTVEVVTRDGSPIQNTGFRWMLEEDNTNQPPGHAGAGRTAASDPLPPPQNKVTSATSIGLDIHMSHAPVVAKGETATVAASALITVNEAKRYFLSVLPNAGYQIGGAPVPKDLVEKGDGVVRVVVNPQPLPTAQISILAFEDNFPINNIPDMPNERGMGGLSVLVADIFGQVSHDAFNNLLGTIYQECAPGEWLDANGEPCIDPAFPPGNGSITTLTYENYCAGRGFPVDPAGTGLEPCDINNPLPGGAVATANPYELQPGEALVKFMPPGKYGIQVVAPTQDANGDPATWIQTATIEGTPTVDAWVSAREPRYFTEGFGAAFNHVFIGFVNPDTLPWAVTPPTGTGSISGRNVFNHFSRPPRNQGYWSGEPVAECWLGLNDPASGQGLAAVACDDESRFKFENVPPGTYQLVSWDIPLDALFGVNEVTVPAGSAGTGEAVPLGDVLSFRWFGSLEGFVFKDVNQNGYRDAGEVGLPSRGINLRYRDGSIYQATITGPDGEYSLSEVFPFFKWLVAEVDFATLKATGMTAVVDYGGPVQPADTNTTGWDPRAIGKLHPQPQTSVNVNTGNNLSRTETGPALLEGLMLFLNQTNIIDWGKADYTGTENGGITGVIIYATTRAENDPRLAGQEDWEPGIPRAQVNLYFDKNNDRVIDDLNGDGGPSLADIDNAPFGWLDGTALRGPEDVDRSDPDQLLDPAVATFDPGDAIQIVWTDSWDDNQPSGCIQDLPVINDPTGATVRDCFDNFGTWNQVRPALFDGGYAFDSYFPGGMAAGSREVSGLPAATYIVEGTAPKGYVLQREQDKNVDFGDSYIPQPQLEPPVCVGDVQTLPTYLNFNTAHLGGETPLPGVDPADLIEIATVVADVDPSMPGRQRYLCDRKLVNVDTGVNAAADFHYYTEVPKAARAVGFSNNDLAAEFDPTSPIFGEKSAPKWLPVSFRDWAGNEISRVYMDEYGAYNSLLPSTMTVNIPTPSGVAPMILTLVLNDPGPIPDPGGSGLLITDPNYDPRFTVTPWSFNYQPGMTSYLDTPLVPVAAFATMTQDQLDTQVPDGVPVIASVAGPLEGALLCSDGPPGTVQLTINSLGTTPAGRDNGFGIDPGQVLFDGVDYSSVGTVSIDSWSDATIVVTVDATEVFPSANSSARLTVVRADNGLATDPGVTVHYAPCSGNLAQVVTGGYTYDLADPYGPIQTAINNAPPGGLVLVGPGVYYESLVMWKPVRLQGSGFDTKIIGTPTPGERLAAWHAFTRALVDPTLTPTEPNPFVANESPAIMVFGNAFDPVTGDPAPPFDGTPALIDGFTLSGSLTGGGIDVNNAVENLTISNNVVTNNQGNYGGGIVLGVPQITDSANNGIVIDHNRIFANGGIQGAGGIAIYNDANDYQVTNNLITANFSRAAGGGIAHVGRSNNGLIRANKILFNEVFYGLLVPGGGSGGGIYLAGETPPPPAPPAIPTVLSSGSGNVTIERNLIQGNLAGAGDGGGIAAYSYNGQDVADNPTTPASWDQLTIVNNAIVNNVAANAGGGISLQDAVAVTIVNNTIANNDSTATATTAFPAGNLTVSNPKPAGIVAYAHSNLLKTSAGASFTQAFADPALEDNIIWQNRSYYNDGTLNSQLGGLLPASLHPSAPHPDVWDLQVANLGTPAYLSPLNNILTSLVDSTTEPGVEHSYDASNRAVDPGLVRSYRNQLQSASVLDEGGNFITLRFLPLLEAAGDYQLQSACSPAVDSAIYSTVAAPDNDLPGVGRPVGPANDLGAYEFVATSPAPDTVLAVLQPNGGEFIPAGSTFTVLWDQPAGATFDVGYSLGAGSPWTIARDVNGDAARGLSGNCFNWSVPGDIRNNNNVKLAIVAHDTLAATTSSDLSDGPFSIDVDSLISPNGGESTVSGATLSITWKINGGARAGLWYQVGDGTPWQPIVNLASNPGRYDWIVPTLAATPVAVRIGVITYNAQGRPLLTDASDLPFTVQPGAAAVPATSAPAPTPQSVTGRTVYPDALAFSGPQPAAQALTLLAPNGNETFSSGEKIPVLWSSPNSGTLAAKVELQLRTGAAGSWTTVAASETDGGYLEWTVPDVDAETPDCLMRVQRLDGNGQLLDSDTSDSAFTIVPTQ